MRKGIFCQVALKHAGTCTALRIAHNDYPAQAQLVQAFLNPALGLSSDATNWANCQNENASPHRCTDSARGRNKLCYTTQRTGHTQLVHQRREAIRNISVRMPTRLPGHHRDLPPGGLCPRLGVAHGLAAWGACNNTIKEQAQPRYRSRVLRNP